MYLRSGYFYAGNYIDMICQIKVRYAHEYRVKHRYHIIAIILSDPFKNFKRQCITCAMKQEGYINAFNHLSI